jgi:hypothetical protein
VPAGTVVGVWVPSSAVPSSAVLAGAVPSEPARRGSVLRVQVRAVAVPAAVTVPAGVAVPAAPAPHSLLPVPTEPIRVAALPVSAHAVPELPSLAEPGEVTDHAAEGALVPRNGANAPADNPEDAETLPARGLRPDFLRRDDEAADGEAADGEAAAAEAVAPAPGESSRGTPGMSQPGSAIVASLRQDRSAISTAHTFDNIVPC